MWNDAVAMSFSVKMALSIASASFLHTGFKY